MIDFTYLEIFRLEMTDARVVDKMRQGITVGIQREPKSSRQYY